MTSSSDEVSTATDVLVNAMVGFVSCINTALPDICSVGWTIGEAYVPFAPDDDDDCDNGEEMCSQAWVRVMGVTPKPADKGFSGRPCAIVLEVDLEVGVLRCIELKRNGEAPTADEVLGASIQAMDDMIAIHNAAWDCESWEELDTGTWEPVGPLGGQYGGTWTFTVEVDTGVNCSE